MHAVPAAYPKWYSSFQYNNIALYETFLAGQEESGCEVSSYQMTFVSEKKTKKKHKSVFMHHSLYCATPTLIIVLFPCG